MTDLIASLAGSIVALINASPRSPTKAEIEKIIVRALPFHIRDAMNKPPPSVGYIAARNAHKKYEYRQEPDASISIHTTDLNEASLVRAIAEIEVSSCPVSGYHDWKPHCTKDDEMFWRCDCGADKP